MWPRRAHYLTPLTDICSTRKKLIWTDTQEVAFQNIKRLVSEDVILRFPDHSQPFHIYIDASNSQIGATIKQNQLPIAYFSRKLAPTQRRYSTIEQEMRAIVKVLKEYRNFLLGAVIIIFTDHKNLLSNSSSNPILNKYPLDLKLIAKHQQLDQALMKALEEDPKFKRIHIYGNELVINQMPRSMKQNIVIPQQLQYPAVQPFLVTPYEGNDNGPYKKCSFYQKYKPINRQYGHLPPKNVQHLDPWDEVHVDMIEPWKAIINKFEYQFRAVTCIDSVVNIPEVIPVENTKSKTVADAFEDNWLSRYPRPRKCIHDNGNEFLGPEFLQMLS